METKRRVLAQDTWIAEAAGRQHGVVSRRQLIELGVRPGAIKWRLAHGRLHSVSRGVYAVGHQALSREGRWMAAVLYAGPGAVLSHRPAAAHWGFRPTARIVVEVSVPSWRRPRHGLRIHQAALRPDEVTELRGIPVTTVPRTLFDLAAVLGSKRELRRALNEVEILRFRDRLSLADLVARYPRRAGAATIRALLGEWNPGETATRSVLEERFLDFVHPAGLPAPELNALVAVGNRRLEVDFVWRRQRLIVELDGHAAHGTRHSFENDRERDRVLQAAGWTVVRVTWRQLHEAGAAVASDLAALLLRADQPPGGV